MNVINHNLLARLINEAEVNHSELARRSEISRGTIGNITKGSTCPSIEIINCLFNSGVLEITKDDFIATFFPNLPFK